MVDQPGGDADGRPLLEIGTIARAHGLSGEVVVALVTNRTERLAPGSELMCRPRGDESAALRALEVRSSRFFKDRYLVEFVGVETREAADALRGALILARPTEDGDSLFVHDMVGMQVVEVDGTRHGVVVAVQANPASDLLVMEDGSLVPLRFLVSKEADRLVVDVPPGLFE